MADDLRLPFPLEILLQIVEASLPLGGPDRIIDIGQCETLLAFTLVSRATYSVATRLIRKHCVYLDSESRMRKFIDCIRAADHPAASTLPPTPNLKSTSSLFLGPYKRGWWSPGGKTYLIRDILIELAPTLRRLVVNIVRRRDAYENTLMLMLRYGLARLQSLEEFVCLGYFPHQLPGDTGAFFKIDDGDPCPWPRLRRLALSEINLRDENFWRELAHMPSLEHVIMVRPFLLRTAKWNVWQSVCQHWNQRTDSSNRRSLPLKFVFVDLEFSPTIVDSRDSRAHDPYGLVSAYSYEVPLPLSARVRADHHCIKAAQNAALQNSECAGGETLWEWEGMTS